MREKGLQCKPGLGVDWKHALLRFLSQGLLLRVQRAFDFVSNVSPGQFNNSLKTIYASKGRTGITSLHVDTSEPPNIVTVT